MNRRLYRCRHDRMVAGVAGGIAEYFDADPAIVRILWIVSIFFGGIGLLLYIVMALIVPLEPEVAPGTTLTGGEVPPDAATGAIASPGTDWHSAPVAHRHENRGTGRLGMFFGVALILFGALALIDAFLPAWVDSGSYLWPAFIVGIGVLLVVGAMRREAPES
jgi:phage shock protein C